MSIATIYFPADWDREQCVKWALRYHPEWERGLAEIYVPVSPQAKPLLACLD